MRKRLALFVITLLAISQLIGVSLSRANGQGEVDIEGRLPRPLYRASAVWDGETAHIFGGMSAIVAMDDVVSFEPASGGPAGMWESPILYVLLAVVIVSLATVVAWLARERG